MDWFLKEYDIQGVSCNDVYSYWNTFIRFKTSFKCGTSELSLHLNCVRAKCIFRYAIKLAYFSFALG